MIDTPVSPAKGYIIMELVSDRTAVTAATLLPIIATHGAPGTEAWSDQWASCHIEIDCSYAWRRGITS